MKQTAGRDSLGEFAPKFAELNDDVLFGQIWSREDKLPLRDRAMITICIFMGKGLVDNSLKYHLINAKNNGITNAGWLGKSFKEVSRLCPNSKVENEMDIVFESYSDKLKIDEKEIDNWIDNIGKEN